VKKKIAKLKGKESYLNSGYDGAIPADEMKKLGGNWKI